jgi:hypothetical protein
MISFRVENLEELNTEYNDYNSAGPAWFDGWIRFVYSTDYPAQGDNFDIAAGIVSFDEGWNEETDRIEFSLESEAIGPFLDEECNSTANEFGPNFISNDPDHVREFIESDSVDRNSFYLFSSDRTGDLDIYYYNKNIGVNSFPYNQEESDESYPTYDYETESILFASDRSSDGTFDIYEVQNEFTVFGDENFLQPTEEAPVKVSSLNSPANDTCPNINENIIVFASDREGGYGGYDLYYSRKSGGEWTAPVNFGDEINSDADEFRPSFYRTSDNAFDTLNSAQVMLFSSNREGGKGGFDLYLAMLPDNEFPELF